MSWVPFEFRTKRLPCEACKRTDYISAYPNQEGYITCNFECYTIVKWRDKFQLFKRQEVSDEKYKVQRSKRT